MTSDVSCTRMSSLEKRPLRSSVHFKISLSLFALELYELLLYAEY